MNWLSHLMGQRGSTTTIRISGKEIEVVCSASANKALAQRSRPLIVEMELAFACFARKTIRFHEQLPDRELAYVTEKLAVYAQAVIPDRCETSQAAGEIHADPGRFMPKRLWLDFKKGRWIGEYSL